MSRSLPARVRRVALAGATCAALLAVPNHAEARSNELAPKHVDLTVQAARRDAKVKTSRTTSNGINYHGGPVILGTTNAYVIWYGAWATTSSPTTQSLVRTMLGNVGGSPYFNINTTYYDGSKTKVSNSVKLVGQTNDPGSQGTALSDAGVQAVVSKAISSGALPKDTNGVYFVLTSAEITETSGFLTQYCGWHTYGSIAGSNLKYSFVGDASANLSACAVQTSTSPNNDPAGDAMVSVIAHELEESVTDPNLNAWYDTRGYENADKCAWTYGTTSTASNGSKYNMTLGGTNFLIQRNWVNASGGYCSTTF
jgi:hypothetical protein